MVVKPCLTKTKTHNLPDIEGSNLTEAFGRKVAGT